MVLFYLVGRCGHAGLAYGVIFSASNIVTQRDEYIDTILSSIIYLQICYLQSLPQLPPLPMPFGTSLSSDFTDQWHGKTSKLASLAVRISQGEVGFEPTHAVTTPPTPRPYSTLVSDGISLSTYIQSMWSRSNKAPTVPLIIALPYTRAGRLYSTSTVPCARV